MTKNLRKTGEVFYRMSLIDIPFMKEDPRDGVLFSFDILSDHGVSKTFHHSIISEYLTAVKWILFGCVLQRVIYWKFATRTDDKKDI